MSQEERSEALVEVLEELEQSDIEFVLVGGYAVRAAQKGVETSLEFLAVQLQQQISSQGQCKTQTGLIHPTHNQALKWSLYTRSST